MDGKIYDAVGIEVGQIEGSASQAVGLLLPTGIGEECDAVYLTLPCAKALLIDLRDAIEAAERYAST